MASLAGNGLPRTTAGSHGTRLRGDLAFAAVLALLASAVIAGAVALYPQTSDASRQRAEEAILPGNEHVAEGAAALEHAEKLDDLAKAGAAARVAIADLELVDTRDISDSQFRRAAKELLEAQRAFLSALQPLARLDESTVSDWYNRRREIRAAVRQIASAQPALVELGLTREMNVWAPVLSWSLANADAVVAAASRRLSTWRSRVQAIRQERRRALVAVTNYDSSVRSDLVTYHGLITDLAGQVQRKVERQVQREMEILREQIVALHPPASVADAHTDLLASIDDTIAAAGLDAAVKDLDRAGSRWQKAVAAEVKRIESIETPKRPDV